MSDFISYSYGAPVVQALLAAHYPLKPLPKGLGVWVPRWAHDLATIIRHDFRREPDRDLAIEVLAEVFRCTIEDPTTREAITTLLRLASSEDHMALLYQYVHGGFQWIA